jgi:glyoxylase-like metal-dependent hydrolase (beta-lactamase superfamily II)
MGDVLAGDKKDLFGGLTLLRLGGHFPGSTVLHWDKGAGGKGVLCTGVTLWPPAEYLSDRLMTASQPLPCQLCSEWWRF